MSAPSAAVIGSSVPSGSNGISSAAAKPIPSVQPTFSFAAAILKGNSTPAPVVAPKKSVTSKPTAAAPTTAPPATANNKQTKANGKSKPMKSTEKAPERVIPLQSGSAWAQKLTTNHSAPIKPAQTQQQQPPAVKSKQQQKKSDAAPSTASTHATESTTSPTTVTPAAPVSQSSVSTSVPASVTPAPSTPATVAAHIVTVAPSPVIATEVKHTQQVKATPTPAVKPATSFAAVLLGKLAAPTSTTSTPSTPAPIATATTPAATTQATAPRMRNKKTDAQKQQPRAAAITSTPNPAPVAQAPIQSTPSTKDAPATTKSVSFDQAALTKPVSSTTQSKPSATSTPVASTTSTTASTTSVMVAHQPATKFGLIEKRPAGQEGISKKKEFVNNLMADHYTPYPLSPYQVFLHDPHTGAVVASMSALNTHTRQIEELSSAPIDAIPFLLIPNQTGGAGELAPLYELLYVQLQFYFSVENLVRDVFLRGRMDSATGYIPLVELLTFPRIRALTSSTYYLSQAAKFCLAPLTEDAPLDSVPRALFKVKRDSLKLRDGWRKWVFPRSGTNANGATKTTAANDDAESSEEEDSYESDVFIGQDAVESVVDASTVSTSENSPSLQSSRAQSPLDQPVVTVA